MITFDIAVVGAGPAGVAAATEAARAGASVLVLDEYAQPGGQYYRQPTAGIAISSEARLFAKTKEGRERIEQARQAGVTYMCDTLVWGVFPEDILSIYTAGRAETLKASKLILACGAHERPVAFPGWTLPGVITAGAAQALLKGQGTLPGHRILMAGTGPLQIAVAAQLVEAGAQLVGILEAGKFGKLFGSGLRFWGQWDRLREGLQYMRVLRSAKVPVRFGRTVLRAAGNPTLSRVTTVALDDAWSPISGSESEVEVDTLCVGFGLVPSTKMARLLGLQLTYAPACGGYYPVHNDCMETSRPDVFVAGESAGVGGAKVAELQGKIAGMTATLQLEKGDPEKVRFRLEDLKGELKKELRFAKSLNETFAPKPGQLRVERPAWFTTLDPVRTVTRVGMGHCQGTMCESLVAQVLARETGREITEVGMYHIRPPLKPVPVGAMADLASSLPAPPGRMDH